MSIDKAGTQNVTQKQASSRLTSETEKQINPSVKFNPRQETSETSVQSERDSHAAESPKTLEEAPTIDSTLGGL